MWNMPKTVCGSVVTDLRDARASFPGVTLFGSMGGFHLVGANEAIIPQTVLDMGTFGLQVIAPRH